jgi:iron complex outermembrane recepter protein
MRRLNVHLGSAGLAAYVLILAPGASAQSTSGARAAPTDTRIADIVVTAQRREQRLQDVPISVSAVSGQLLARANIQNATNLNKLVPSVLIQANEAGVTTFIRGLGNNQVAVGNEPSNPLYIDGVYYPRINTALLQLNNIDRIEVLKGPQGTLFGRNAASGLIQIITRTPEPGAPLNAKLSLGYGNYETIDANAYISSGLGNHVAADLAVLYSNQGDGFGKDLLTGKDWLKDRQYALRSKWVFKPADGTKFTLVGNYSREHSSTGIAYPIDVGGTPADPRGQTGLPDGSGLAPLPSFYDRNTDTDYHFLTKSYGAYGRIEQDISFATLIDTVSYQHLQESFLEDVDGTVQHFAGSLQPALTKTLSNELQLVSKPGSALEWTIGSFFFDNKSAYDPAYIYGPGFGGTLVAPAHQTLQSYAGYGQATYTIAPKVRVTLGLRYTSDQLKGAGGVLFSPVDSCPVACPSATGTLNEARANFSKLTWRGVIDYKPTDNVLAYASISRGYKSGLLNLLTFSATPVEPTTVDAYEVGLKTELFDRHFQLNLAAFRYNEKKPQVTVIAFGTTALLNAPGAHVTGIEAEANGRLGHLTIRASGTYLDAHYTSFTNAPFYMPNPSPPYGFISVQGDASGNPLAIAPKFSGSAGADYEIPFANGSSLTIGGSYYHVGTFYWDPDLRVKGGKYGLVDAQVSYRLPNTNLKFTVWGSNLTQEKYLTAEYEQAGPFGLVGSRGMPRRFGVRLNYAFR